MTRGSQQQFIDRKHNITNSILYCQTKEIKGNPETNKPINAKQSTTFIFKCTLEIKNRFYSNSVVFNQTTTTTKT